MKRIYFPNKIPSFVKHPVPGRAYKPFTDELIELPASELPPFFFKRLVEYKGKQYAIFSDVLREVMQSVEALALVRCRPGEENINSKLSNSQSNMIWLRANNGADKKELAAEFNVTEKTVTSIANFSQRARVTLNWLNGIPEPTK